MIKIATGTEKETIRNIEDYILSRYACYLIAQMVTQVKRNFFSSNIFLLYKQENKKYLNGWTARKEVIFER